MTELTAINFTITTIVFYWLYLIMLLLYSVVALLNIYHLVLFGPRSVVNYSIIVIFIFISLIIIGASTAVLSAFDWSVPLFNPSWVSAIGGLLNFDSANFKNLVPTIKL